MSASSGGRRVGGVGSNWQRRVVGAGSNWQQHRRVMGRRRGRDIEGER